MKFLKHGQFVGLLRSYFIDEKRVNALVCVCMYVCMYVCLFVCLFVWVCMFVMYVCVYVFIKTLLMYSYEQPVLCWHCRQYDV
jgi:hypothetical protein